MIFTWIYGDIYALRLIFPCFYEKINEILAWRTIFSIFAKRKRPFYYLISVRVSSISYFMIKSNRDEDFFSLLYLERKIVCS